jgi:RHS repeat-associated protein
MRRLLEHARALTLVCLATVCLSTGACGGGGTKNNGTPATTANGGSGTAGQTSPGGAGGGQPVTTTGGQVAAAGQSAGGNGGGQAGAGGSATDWSQCAASFASLPTSTGELEVRVELALTSCPDPRRVLVIAGSQSLIATPLGSGRYRRYVPLAAGPNAISAILLGPSGERVAVPAISITYTPTTPSSGASSGFVRGSVWIEADAPNPLPGATIFVRDQAGSVTSGADGTFTIPVPGRGTWIVNVQAPGHTYAQRRVTLEDRDQVAIDPVYLVALDSARAELTPTGGGTLTTSAGDVSVKADPGAVTESQTISALSFPRHRSLPGALPDSSAWTQALDLYPEGLIFAQPVEVRMKNLNGFAPGFQVPVGYYNRDTAAWETETMATVSSDGQWLVLGVDHFSPRDLNLPPTPRKRPKKKETQDDKCKNGSRGASIVGDVGGQLVLDHPASRWVEMGETRGLNLVYDSGAGLGQVDLVFPVDLDAAAAVDGVRVLLDLQGRTRTFSQNSPSGTLMVAARFPALDVANARLADGPYPVRVELTKLERSTYMTANSFGAGGEQDTGVSTRDPLAFTNRAPAIAHVHDLTTSPFGAGWTLDQLEQVRYHDGLGIGTWVRGVSRPRTFVMGLPTANPVSAPTQGYSMRLHAYANDGTLFFTEDGANLRIASSRSQIGTATSVAMPRPLVALLPWGDRVVGIDSQMMVQSIGPSGASQQLFGINSLLTAWNAVHSDDDLSASGSQGQAAIDRDSRLWLFGYSGLNVSGHSLIGISLAGTHDVQAFRMVATSASGDPTALHYSAGEHALYYVMPVDGEFRRVDVLAHNESVVLRDEELESEVQLVGARSADGVSYLFDASNGRAYQVSRLANLNPLFRLAADQYRVLGGQVLDVTLDPAGQPSFALLNDLATTPTSIFTSIDGNRGLDPASLDRITRSTAGSVLVLGDDQHEFDAAGRITGLVDAGGRRASFTWTGDKLTAYQSPTGHRTTFDYAGANAVTITDPGGNARQLTMDTAQRLTQISNPDGTSTDFTYDANGRMTARASSNGSVTYSWDDLGSVTGSRFDTGDAQTYLSVIQAAQPAGIASAISAQSLLIDSAGRLHTRTYDANGTVSRYCLGADCYDVLNGVDADVQAHYRVTQGATVIADIKYDRQGRVTDVDDHGQTVEMVMRVPDTQILPLPSSRPMAIVILSDVCTFSYPDANTTQINCGGRPALTLVRDPATGGLVGLTEGNATYAVTSDAHGNRLTETDAIGGVATVTRNAAGHVTALQDAAGRTTRFGRNPDGDLTSITDSAGGTWSATLTRSTACVACGADGITVLRSVTDPLGLSWQTGIRSDGQVASFTTPSGKLTTYSYAGDSGPSAVHQPDGTTVAFARDGHGRLSSLAAGATTTTFTYASDSTVAVAESPSFRVSRDRTNGSKDVVETVVDKTTGVALSLTATENIAAGFDSKLTTVFGSSLSLTWIGGVAAQTVETDGPTVLIGTSDYRLPEIRVDDASQQTVVDRTWSVDQLGRPTDLNLTVAGSTWDHATFSYVGSLRHPASVVWDNGRLESTDIAYDAADRLTSLGTSSYSYDLGGRITHSSYAGDFAYSPDSELISTGLAQYTYNDNGGRASRSGTSNGERWLYDYDTAGQLVGVRKFSSAAASTPYSTVALAYDPWLRLTRVTVDGSHRYYQWHGFRLMSEVDASGSLVRRYVPAEGLDGVGAMFQNGAYYYAVRDTMGSVVAWVDGSGNEVASYRYDPYGRVLSASGAMSPQPRRFLGALYLEELGLYYLRTRWLDPEVGQFLTPEPVLSLRYARYGYCGSRPHVCTDSMGLDGSSSDFGAGAQALGGLMGDQASGAAVSVGEMALGELAGKVDLPGPPIGTIKSMYDAVSGYEKGNYKKNADVALDKLTDSGLLKYSKEWNQIVKDFKDFLHDTWKDLGFCP